MNILELKQKCKSLNFKGYSTKNKKELLEMIETYEKSQNNDVNHCINALVNNVVLLNPEALVIPVITNVNKMNMSDLNIYLQNKIKELNGLWILKNSGYDNEACVNLGFNCEKSRYWDCEYNGLYIEIKKGISIWLDEVRYCEIFMSDNDKCKQETITIFLIPSKDKNTIKNIYIIDTRKIIQFLKINTKWAETLLFRHKEIAHSLNCQQSMTLNDLKKIANYII